MNSNYQICTRCIMDTTDRDIFFDSNGVCNHCWKYEELTAKELYKGEEAKAKLDQLLIEIKENGKNKDYDCIIGVSGGVDSTYLAYLVKKLELRPLAVHLDNGWDSELAVHNIEKVLKKLGIDLYTYVIDWEEFKDLQLSFLKASVSDAEIPTDHAIIAIMYRMAAERRIPIISGANIATEAILPTSWTYGIGDWKYIKSIHKRFGRVKLKSFPHFSRNDILYYTFVKGVKSIQLLNYVPYIKKDVMQVLEHELGWQYYGGKHYESIYTRFFQGYILPRKFNIDKRRAHLSNLICAEQMAREEALEEIKHDTYLEDKVREDKEYVIKKLGLDKESFEEIMSLPVKTYLDYPNYNNPSVYDPLREYKAKTY
jgi:N-acetyl sugar amidotransferase